MISYFAKAPTGRLILWGYLLWYLHIALSHFDASWALWGNSLGIALVVGTALVLSTTPWPILWRRLDRWQITRLYLMPFCVSSYSALIKGQGFVFLFPPAWIETFRGLALELAFVAWLLFLRRRNTD